MLKTIDIINKLSEENKEKYGEMIRQVNIPDFYKCIAQFSGIAISKLNDDRIVEYLTTWAESKFRFYQMLGNKLKLDTPFVYENERDNYSQEYREIAKKFPIYALWLQAFEEHKTNNIGSLDYRSLRNTMKDLFPKFQYEKASITHFFKSQLNAPDELVTEIGKIYENKKIEATHTLSIDPVDIMFASENPYEWNSCYRLELGRSDSHADGCMAAVLDTSSLISYVWSSEGEYNMYDSFKFKKVRYYRIRQWINISDGYEAIHFASAYPNRDGYEGTLNKQLREVVETIVSKFAKVENKWRRAEYITVKNGFVRCEVHIDREFLYGYNEFDEDYVWVNSELVPKMNEAEEGQIIEINPYNKEIKCACGCNGTVYPSDDAVDEDDAYDGDTCYNGNGFCAENYYTYEEEPESKWCDYCDDYCTEDLTEDDCCKEEDCPIWKRNHKFCKLANEDDGEMCDRADQVSTYTDDDGTEKCDPNECDCDCCWYWERHQKKLQEQEAMKEDKEDE